jgi:succinoglycan biosynthesis transport protein ExoP
MERDGEFSNVSSGELLPTHKGAVSQYGASGWTQAYLEPLDALGARHTEGDLFEYLNLVRYRKYTVIFALAIGTLVAWAITLIQTPLYSALADIEIKSMAESDSVYRIVDKDWQGGTGNAVVTPESYLETQLHILNSRSFQARVLDKVRSAPRAAGKTDLSDTQKLLSKIGLKPQASPIPGFPPVKCASKTVENTRIVQVTCESPDPAFAADYANTMAQEFIAYNLEVQTSTAEHTLQWLTNRLADMRGQVEQARAKLDQYSAASGVRFEANEPDTEKSALGDIQKDLAAAHVQRINDEAAYEVAMVASRSDQALDEHWATSQEQLLKFKNQLQQLGQRYTADHPQVVQLKAEIDTLQKIMTMQASAYVGILKERYDASQLREKRLSEALSHQSDVVLGAARKSTEYENLRRELDRNQKLYEDLLQKATEVSLSTAMRGSSQIRVVDSAEVPVRPFRPAIAKTVSLGCATGLMLGIGLVFIGERTNHRLRRPGEAPFHLSLPELAVVPNCESIGRVTSHNVGDSKSPSSIRRLLHLAGSQMGSDRMALEKPERVAESFRGAVTSLIAYRSWRKSSKKIMATSPAQGDGKSTVVSNLGITFAELGYSVVLVDGDIRRPHLNEIFSLTNSWGLTTLVTGDNNISTAPIEALVQKTRIDNLSVLTAGPGTSSISRVLHSKVTAQLFERLASEFDFVLVDSPPVVEFSDARLLGRLVDGAILVVQSGVTTRETAMAVRDRLLEDNLTIIGTILNKWDGKVQPSNYYGYRYHADPV